MDAKLVVIGGKANMGEVKLRLPMTIGRGHKADLIISHPTVSREHCKLSEVKGHLVVLDNGSSNGTFVDGDKIEKATVVRPGQILAIGPLTFRAEYDLPGTGKKRKEPKPEESGLAETQAIDRGELDIDFILDDAPAGEAPEPKQKAAGSSAEQTIEAKLPDAAKKPIAKAPLAPKQADKPKAPSGGETDEMDLDFLLDEVPDAKKSAPSERDAGEIDFSELGFDEPKAKSGDQLTTDFSATSEKTVDFKAEDVELDESFFEEIKPEVVEKKVEKSVEKGKSKPEASAPATKAPAAKIEPPAPKIEPPAPVAKQPVEKQPPAEKPKKSGGLDFDFLSAGPAAAEPLAGPAKAEVGFDDLASQFDFTGSAKAKVAPEEIESKSAELEAKSEPVQPESVQPEPIEAPAPAMESAASLDDDLDLDAFLDDVAEAPTEMAPAAEAADQQEVENLVATDEQPAPDEQKLFDDFPETPSAAASSIEESAEEPAPFEAREEELVWDETPSPEEIALDDVLVEETLAKETPQQPAAAAPSPADVDEFPFTEPVAPPTVSELPPMPEMASAAEVEEADDIVMEEPAIDEPPFHAAADAAAVAPAERAESFTFDAPPAEVPVFDAASESMSLADAVAAEHEPTFDFDSLDDSAAESPVEELKEEELEEISLDLDEVPSAPPPAIEPIEAKQEPTFDFSNFDVKKKPKPKTSDETVAFTGLDLDSGKTAANIPSILKPALPEVAKQAPAIAPPSFAPLATEPVALEPMKSTSAPADDFDFLSGEASPAATSDEPKANEPEAAADMFADFSAAAPSAAAPSFDLAPPTNFAVGPISAKQDAPELDAAELDVTEQFVSPAAPLVAPSKTTPAKASKPAVAKVSVFDKIKMLFSGSAKPKAKPSKPAKKSATAADAPVVNKLPVAPPKQSFDPIPLDDSPLPMFDVTGPKTGGAAIGPIFDDQAASVVTSGWKSLDAPIPLDDVSPAAAPALETPDQTVAWGAEKPSEATPPENSWDQAAAGEAAVSEAAPADAPVESAASDEFDLFAGDFFTEEPSAEEPKPADAVAETAAVEELVVSEPVVAEPAATESTEAKSAEEKPTDEEWNFDEWSAEAPVAENPAVEGPAVESPIVESPAAEAPFFLDDFAPAVEKKVDAEASPPAPATESESPGLFDDFTLAESTSESSAAAEPTAAPDPHDWMASLDPVAADALPAETAVGEAAPEAKEEVAAAKDEDLFSAWDSEAAPEPAADSESPAASESLAAEAASAPSDPWSQEVPLSSSPEAWEPAVLEADAEVSVAADSAISDSAAQDSPAGDAPPFELMGLEPIDEAAPAAEALAPAAPSVPAAPPVSNRQRSVDVDLRLSSSLRSLTRVSVRPPRFDVVAMEPETPAGRSFEPRPKSAPSIAAATDTTATPPVDEEPQTSSPENDAQSNDASSNETLQWGAAPTSEADAATSVFAFDEPAGDADPWGIPKAESTPPAEAVASGEVEAFSFVDETADEPLDANANPELAAKKNDTGRNDGETDRTVAYLGSPSVVEEAESFLAGLDDPSRATREPEFDLDAMFAETETAKAETAPWPTDAGASVENAAPSDVKDDAKDEAEMDLSFLSLSDDVAETTPVEESPAASIDPSAEVAHVPSAEIDLGFLDLASAPKNDAIDLGVFGLEAAEPVAEMAEPKKAEPAKNGTKPVPQPAAAPASQKNDAELDDFLRDLGMN
ncbi:MAG: FHA domain-containing protein [Planctomycetia bacterium]|nr:FHA domain-containing protein [Planctomycetia bacterium]